MKALHTIVVVSLLTITSCGQPKVRCFTAIGTMAAKYTLKEGTGPCSTLVGDTIGMATYNPPLPDGTPDLTKANIAIGTDRLGSLADRAAAEGIVDATDGHARNARGDFATMEPDEDDICTVPTLSPAHLSFPELPAIEADEEAEIEGEPAHPPMDISYTWKDMEFWVTPGSRGQQAQGTLVYEENGCVATYSVRAVFPAIDCTGDDGGPDDRWCASEGNEFNGGVGSGIQEIFPTKCDPDLLLCVLKDQEAFPVLQEIAAE